MNPNNSLKLLCWNIQGLTDNVINDDYFKHCMTSNDIIVLTESWLTDQVEICPTEFYNYHNLRPMHARARRASGGISVMIRHRLRRKGANKGISIIKETDCTVWLKLDKHFLHLCQDIFICAIYIPPENSSYWRTHDFDPFLILEQDVTKFQEKGEVILVGDFNARTGDKPDYVPDFTNDDNLDQVIRSDSNVILENLGRKHRSNMDNVVNAYGTKLIELCKGSNIRILNGRTLGDSQGSHTSFQYNGMSAVDYVIASENIMHIIPIVTVSQPTHLSDHAHINYSINLGKYKLLSKTHSTSISHESKLQYKWDQDSGKQFEASLKLPIIRNKLDNLAKVDFQIDQHGTDNFCQDLANIINSAAKLCLKTLKKNKKSPLRQRHKMGFDKECKILKDHVLHLGKLVFKNPRDPAIYGQFISMKKKFKKLVKQKFKESKEAILQQIMNQEKNNPKKFWKLLNDLRSKKEGTMNPIEMDHWSTYFDNLHNTKQKPDKHFTNTILNKLQSKINSITTTSDKDFTMEEILTGIKSLKLNKSSGLDAISNEMIKSGANILSPYLCKLFNHILRSECYPNLWSTGFIVPIYKKGSSDDPSNYRGISICCCTAKLFALLINNRLQKFLVEHDIISKFQIGFVKGKRTSDHIFVLKCLIEEAKAKKQPIFGCFVDLKKAFDTVWIQGLLFKLLHKYSISPKLVRLLDSMYSNLKARVCSNGELGPLFNVTIGTRQGCNLSPTLFNLYINDIPEILKRVNCDPVILNSVKINTLMYADDMLLLSKSYKGLNKSIKLLEVYCRKWQLQINTDKTKIMIFNKRKTADFSFKVEGKCLEIVTSYKYLGMKICNSGSFTSTIKDLADKARRAYFSMNSSFSNMNINPRLFMKLFDTLVKPIAIYGSEVWGAFGHKVNIMENIMSSLYNNSKSPYEQLHLKSCKRAINVSKRASNLGTLAEMGRFPLTYNILIAICKYRRRLETFSNNDLLFHALESQKKMQHNAYKSISYYNFTEKLLSQLNLKSSSNTEWQRNNNLTKSLRKSYVKFFQNSMFELRNRTDTKLSIYANIKQNYCLETYLDLYPKCQNITKFRLSDHNLPIERGRYLKPKLSRDMRICNICKVGVGDEFHVLFQCQNNEVRNLHDVFMARINIISPQISKLQDNDKFLYFLRATDSDITPIFENWLCKVNAIFKKTIYGQ